MSVDMYIGFEVPNKRNMVTYVGSTDTPPAGVKALALLDGCSEEVAQKVLDAWKIVQSWDRNNHDQLVGQAAYAARKAFLKYNPAFALLFNEVSTRFEEVSKWCMYHNIDAQNTSRTENNGAIVGYLHTVLDVELDLAKKVAPLIKCIYWG